MAESQLDRIERRLDRLTGRVTVEHAFGYLVEALHEADWDVTGIRFHDSGSATMYVRGLRKDGTEFRLKYYKQPQPHEQVRVTRVRK